MKHVLHARALVALAVAAGTARSATPATDVRVLRVSGDGQSARAFAASTGPGYETAFPQPLVVRIASSRGARASTRTIRFACVERDCRFALAEEGDDVTRVDARSYDVRVDHGRATLPLTLSTDRVGATFTVRARPRLRSGERAAGDAFFHLQVR